MITDFNITLLTFHDWFQWSGTSHGWQVSFPPLSHWCTHQTQHTQALSFIKLGWQLSHFMEWDTPSTVDVLHTSKSVCIVTTINFHAFYVFRVTLQFNYRFLHCKWILLFVILIFLTVWWVWVTNNKTLLYMKSTNGCDMCLQTSNISKN
jgi:hypothetical protein